MMFKKLFDSIAMHFVAFIFVYTLAEINLFNGLLYCATRYMQQTSFLATSRQLENFAKQLF